VSNSVCIPLDIYNIEDYHKFIAIKQLPRYSVAGGFAYVPKEYSHLIGKTDAAKDTTAYTPPSWMFDYQKAITAMALKKQKYAVFADCGLGKTPIILEFAREAARRSSRGKCLIVAPLMVCKQTVAEAEKFYPGENLLQHVTASGLTAWMKTGTGIAITNYEAITDEIEPAPLDALILDESSMLKSHYGAWGTRLIELGRGVKYKLCATGTPAPNDRIEYANHAVFLDAFPTVNSFLARFFVNRGQTNERWELKPHALKPFYIALSHWCIFLTNPAVYGWKDNCGTLPPIHVHIENVPLTGEQRDALMESHGTMFVNEAGGIGSRGKIARIGKGFHAGKKIDSNKTAYIARMVRSWPNESVIIWCKYNQEQEDIAAAIPEAGNISGETPLEEREQIIAGFKSGKIRVIITKPKILGFGLNLQIATRQVFSGLQDSYEEYYQAVKRSNRYGSTKALNVHIPITELEAPMVQTVMAKAHRVQADTEQQEKMFYELASRS
jgi:hypothetical protein